MNLQVHVSGRHSIGKSPLMKFAISLYGNPRFGKLATTFNSTAKSRQEHCAALRDLPVWIDELESISKFDADRLPADIYNYSLGQGRIEKGRYSTASQTFIAEHVRQRLCRGKCPTVDEKKLPPMLILPENKFAVLS